MTLHICGDSTAATYPEERRPMTGWGQVIGEMLPGVRVSNRAIAGRSSRSFRQEGRLESVGAALCPGDLMLIQFTHNDAGDRPERHTDPETTFPENLNAYVDTARLHGATPVLLTPIPRCCWKNGALQELHGAYPDAIRRLAAARHVPLIDVLAAGTAALCGMGEAASAALYMNPAVQGRRLDPALPEDDAHTRRAGAELFARITAEGLRKLGLLPAGEITAD